MKRGKLTLLCAALAAVILLVCGWLLLPEEKEPSSLKVLGAQDAEEFEYVYVTRNNMEQWADITCRFRSLQQEHLRFRVDGRVIGKIYVEVGDDVEPGQLLAELENEPLDQMLEDAQENADRMEKELEFARTDLEIISDLGDQDQIERYEETVARLEEDAAIAGQRLQELQKQRRDECLYATIEGTVTYVRNYNMSKTEGDTIVISDRGDACFYADTEYYDSIRDGMEVTLSTDEGEVRAVVTAAEKLGFDPDQVTGNNKRRVYFLPKVQLSMMNDNSKAELELLLDSRENVLTIPERAVFFAGGRSMVYYENENGVREAKPVELGLRTSGRYEVLSGLEEGEALIVG